MSQKRFPNSAKSQTILLSLVPYVTSEGSSKCWLCDPDPWPFEPKINRLGHNVEDYYCAKSQVIPSRGFLFIVLTYPQTNKQTNRPTHTLRRTTSARIKVNNVRPWQTTHDLHIVNGRSMIFSFLSKSQCYDIFFIIIKTEDGHGATEI